MTAQTHFTVTTAIAILMKLKGIDLVYIYLFGFFIDFDHLLSYYMLPEKESFMKESFRKKTPLHTILHEPIFFIPVGIISFLLNNPTPLIGWISHIIPDHLILKSSCRPLYPIDKRWYNYGLIEGHSKWEIVISSLLASISIFALAKYINFL